MNKLLYLIKTGIKYLIVQTPLNTHYYKHKALSFDKNIVIYKGETFAKFMDDAFRDFRPGISPKEKQKLEIEMIISYLRNGTRPDEYLLYGFDHKDSSVQSTYLPQKPKDDALIKYYGSEFTHVIDIIKDKYSFYTKMKKFFNRDAALVSCSEDWISFNEFCHKHKRFIAKENKGACGVGVHIIEINDEADIKQQFNRLLKLGDWIVEELIIQDSRVSEFNSSSINTVRFPSFRHGNDIRQAYPCMRFGRSGSVVDNAGQSGIFVSVDINTGKIISDAFNEHGARCETHPDSGKKFIGFKIPRWDELLRIAKEIHLTMPGEQTYVAFDFALSDKGWVLVEANWGDWVLQQTSLQRGLKKEFISLLYNK